MTEQRITFADTVLTTEATETLSLGMAGKTGSVHGFTTPSITGVSVVGTPQQDFAVNVYFEDTKKNYWIAEHLLEFVDHGAGTEIKLHRVSKRWIRTAAGEWIEQSGEPDRRLKPWWRFWP